MRAAATFSLQIFIDEKEITEFWDVKVSASISGMGTSGVCISQLTFTCFDDFFVSRAAKVDIRGSGILLPTYFVSERDTDGETITFTCLDKLAFADDTIETDSLNTDGDGNVSIYEIFSQMESKYGIIGGAPFTDEKISREMVEDCTFTALLDKLSVSYCGFWYITNLSNLAFLKFGEKQGVIDISEHSALKRSEVISYKGLRVVNGSSWWEHGDTSLVYDTLIINSELSTKETAERTWKQIEGKIFRGFKCQNAFLEYTPALGNIAKFEQDPDNEYRITSITMTFEGGYIAASLSGDVPNCSEISRPTKLKRLFDEKVDLNKTYGCTQHTPYQGDIVIDSEEVVNSG